MNAFISLCCVATLIPAVPLLEKEYKHAGATITTGSIASGDIYTLGLIKYFSRTTKKESYSELLLQRITIPTTGKESERFHSLHLLLHVEAPLHHRVGFGSLWINDLQNTASTERIPIDELSLACLSVVDKGYKKRFGNSLFPFRWEPPEATRTARGGNFGFGSAKAFKVWASVLPVATTEVLVFLLRETKPEDPEERGEDLIEVYRGVGRLHKDTPSGEAWGVEWKKQETFEADFREDFVAHRRGEDYYFITEAGRVFVACKPEKGKQRRMEEIWGKDKPPITGILTDNDKKEVYLFGKSKDSKDRAFFFPLSAKPQPKEFDAALLSAAKTVDEPMKTVIGMVRAVQAADKKSK